MNVHPPKPKSRPATYPEIGATLENVVAEIIDGELVTHPRPSYKHGGAASGLGIKFGAPFQHGMDGGPGGWIFLDKPELKFQAQILLPDIAGWRRERLSSYPETDWLELRPDWVCEVLPGSTEQRDRTVKRRIYAEAQIPYLWFVDPRQQLLEEFELTKAGWVLLGTWNSDDVRALPFETNSFSLADLWPLDKPLGFNEDPLPLYAGDR